MISKERAADTIPIHVPFNINISVHGDPFHSGNIRKVFHLYVLNLFYPDSFLTEFEKIWYTLRPVKPSDSYLC